MASLFHSILTGAREAIAKIPGHYILEPDFVAKGFLQLVEDESLNGAIMRVTPQKGIDFARYPNIPATRLGQHSKL